MNPVKYFTNSKKGQYIGTFVCEVKDDGPRFGWSRYNFNREKGDGIPFRKKVGRECAIESIGEDIVIDTTKGNIHKGEIVVHDPQMVKSAMDFIAGIKRRYKKVPNNVKIYLSINYMKKIVQAVAEQNEKFRKEIFMLKNEKLKLLIDNGILFDKLRMIKKQCTD